MGDIVALFLGELAALLRPTGSTPFCRMFSLERVETECGAALVAACMQASESGRTEVSSAASAGEPSREPNCARGDSGRDAEATFFCESSNAKALAYTTIHVRVDSMSELGLG